MGLLSFHGIPVLLVKETDFKAIGTRTNTDKMENKLLFIYFWLHWVFIAARRLSLVVASRGYSLLRCTGSRHAGFSICGSRALEHRLSSCGART